MLQTIAGQFLIVIYSFQASNWGKEKKKKSRLIWGNLMLGDEQGVSADQEILGWLVLHSTPGRGWLQCS